ncbi:phage head spike fiber domain-containing protein [Vreelandella venusta]|uniref:phage head spike fiber domain-containing protein n=1 Tax=Vreelandella venusta TaxID=44935 RepID=UPI0018DAEACF|nr:hypothetical protein [Halomonas venusta]QPI62447.1 hypothetical protein IR195_11110 [Halomonas venusta]
MASIPTVDFSQYQWVVNDTNYLTKWNNFQTAINTLQANINKFGAEAKAEADSAIGIAQSLIESYEVSVLDPFIKKSTIDFDFESGIYRVDDGSLIETKNISELCVFERSTPKRYRQPSGHFGEAGINEIARGRSLSDRKFCFLYDSARTNLFTKSEFQSGVSGTGSISASTIDFGDGAVAAAEFSPSPSVSFLYKSGAIANTEMTLSVFVEMEDGSAPSVSSASGAGSSVDFAINIGGSSTGGQGYKVERVYGNVYRVSNTRVTGETFLGNNGLVKLSSNSQKSFKVSGYMLEVGQTAGEYITTDSTSSTVTSDYLRRSLSQEFNSMQGTFFVQLELPDDTGANYILQAGNATSSVDTTNSYLLWRSSGRLFLNIFGDSGSMSIDTGQAGVGLICAAFSISHDGLVSVSVNGVSSVQPMDVSINHAQLAQLLLGIDAGGSKFKKYKRFLYSPYAATAAELDALTARGQS